MRQLKKSQKAEHRIPMALDFIGVGGRGGKEGDWLAAGVRWDGAISLWQSAL